MLRKYFENTVINAIKNSEFNDLINYDELKLNCEIPKNKEFGDFAINISSLSRVLRMAPPVIAQKIAEKIKPNNFEINIAGGFLNFKIGSEMLNSIIKEILEKLENYGSSKLGNGEKVIIEYVSANPTGPLHIGHGRWAAMGSSLANLLNFAGYNTYQEFYINDAGNQINKLGKSLHIRVLQELGFSVDFPQSELERKDYYTGDYLISTAKKFVEQNYEIAKKMNVDISPDMISLLSGFARNEMLSIQKQLLEHFNVHFDNYFSELTLHKSGKVDSCINKLQELDMLYEKDGAIWFRSTKYTDDQDRVIKKNDGSNTYLTADIAYHYDKFERGFERLIDIWGADHHGYIPRMKASISALGHNPDMLEVLLGQLVNLVVNNEQVRMGKRSKMITLEDLIEEVGVDATRYWMIMRSIDTTLDFDVELAKSKTDDNPVFYVQYAHARACSILRNVLKPQTDVESKEVLDAPMTEDEFNKIDKNTDLSSLWSEEKANNATKNLVLKLEEYKNVIETSAKNRTPYLICKYLQELASEFHSFYAVSRVIVEDKKLMSARIGVIKAVITVIKSGLTILGISAPERM